MKHHRKCFHVKETTDQAHAAHTHYLLDIGRLFPTFLSQMDEASQPQEMKYYKQMHRLQAIYKTQTKPHTDLMFC